VALPAGYATARFVGRRLVLALTLIAMPVPASALVLLVFLS
jgi:ABC-type glycerol-3-phosphate transport system permease component